MTSDASYQSRQRWARMLTIGVTTLVVLASAAMRIGGESNTNIGQSSEQGSMTERFAQSRLLLHQRAEYLKEQWNEALHQSNTEQSFAQFVEEKLKHNSP